MADTFYCAFRVAIIVELLIVVVMHVEGLDDSSVINRTALDSALTVAVDVVTPDTSTTNSTKSAVTNPVTVEPNLNEMMTSQADFNETITFPANFTASFNGTTENLTSAIFVTQQLGNVTMETADGSWDNNTVTDATPSVVPIDPCDQRLCQHICSPLNNSQYTCSCYHGYRLDANGLYCRDIDECQENPDLCGAEFYCKNRPGSYDCICAAGFVEKQRSCVAAAKKFLSDLKVDTVTTTTVDGNVTMVTGDALNIDDNYNRTKIAMYNMVTSVFGGLSGFVQAKVISLRKGSIVGHIELYFTSAGPENASVLAAAAQQSLKTQGCDVTNSASVCNISNVIGLQTSFNVSAADPCVQMSDNTCDQLTTTCSSHPDGSFTCPCKSGYLHRDGSTSICTDVDECTQGLDSCDNDTSVCQNTDGSYKCSCQFGYIKEKGICVDACDPNPCKHDGRCTKTSTGYNCRCEGIWTGNSCQQEHQEALRYKLIAILVGVLMGLLCFVLLVAFMLACCRSGKAPRPRHEPLNEVRMNDWEYERQSPRNVQYQMVEADGGDKELQQMSTFNSSGLGTGSEGTQNPAFQHDSNSGSRTRNA